MKLTNKAIACTLCFLLCLTAIPYSDASVSAEPDVHSFQHPGILNSAEELQIMKHYAASEDACEPWTSAYNMLIGTVETYYDMASSSFINIDWLGTTVIVRSNSGGWNDMRVAATKVYNLSVAYYITGNDKYAQTARDVMMHYADQFIGIGSKTDGGGLYDINLPVSVIAVKFCSAAEILEYSGYSGWSDADAEHLRDMFIRNTGEDTVCSMARLLDWTNDADGLMSQYDMNDLQHGHAAFANAGALAYAVYAENQDLYERTLANLCADAEPAYKQAQYSWLRKPVQTGCGGALAYNINPVTGQNKEADRDMTHSNVEIAEFVTAALIAEHQNDDDVFEAHNRLLLKGVEYLARYNLGYDTDYISEYPWNVFCGEITTDNRGGCIRKDPMFEAAYNYYRYHSDADESEMQYLTELINNPTLSPERISEDVSGMGTLLYSDPDRAETDSAFRRTNPDFGIAAENYLALVQNAAMTADCKIRISAGETGIVTYEMPPWSSDGYGTTQIGIELASTSGGVLEFRSQSKDGAGYGQVTASQMESGNTGTLLARLRYENTCGVTAKVKGVVYDANGQHGGTLETLERDMLFVVVYPDTGDVLLGDITYRPSDEYVYSDLFQPHITPVLGDVDLDGFVSVSDAVLMQQYLLCQTAFAFEQYYKGDLNSDRRLNAIDLTLLKRILLNGK